MRYIDKNAKRTEGRNITDEYLDNECRTTDQVTGNIRYMNVDYSGSFTNKGYKNKLLELGMALQNKFCCYCLRKIGRKQFATLEHIIPQSSKTTNSYDRYNELSEHEIVLTSDFTSADNQTRPPYPHTVAWNNLVVSCNGRFPLDNNVSSHCCNNARSSDFAPPVYYLRDIESRIVFMQDGTMMAGNSDLHDDVQSTINAAKLNYPALKEIRRLWYLLRNRPYREIVECLYDRNLRTQTLYSIFSMKDLADIRLVCKYQKDEYWEVFMKYHLFYTIFQDRN